MVLERLHTTNQPKRKKGKYGTNLIHWDHLHLLNLLLKKSCCIQTKAVPYNISGKSWLHTTIKWEAREHMGTNEWQAGDGEKDASVAYKQKAVAYN
jgi:hypothetical protein